MKTCLLRGSLLGCLAAFVVAGSALAAGPMVSIEVGTVLASNTVQRIDQRLEGQGMQARLTRMFQYRSYELVGHQAQAVAMEGHSAFALPGGLTLAIHPRGIPAPGRVALGVELRRGAAVLMDSSVTLGQDGRVLLGGPAHEDGVLLVWIGAHLGVPRSVPAASPQAAGHASGQASGLLPANATESGGE